MSLQFITGNSGNGKTKYLFNRIVKEAKANPRDNYLVIVPEQFTMQTQRQLVDLSENKAIMNIDVLSFKRLAYRVFDELGITNLTVLEETGKNLVLRKLAAQEADKLGVIGRNLNRIGYISEVKSLLSELVQYNISPEELGRYIASGRLSDTLSDKLKDVLVLYEAFEKFMQDKYITAEEILNVLSNVAEESAILRNSVIAFDEFTGFTPIQNQLIKKLFVISKKIYVTLTIDCREDIFKSRGMQELFDMPKRTVKSLTEMAAFYGIEVEEPIILDKNYRLAENEELSFMEQQLFRKRRCSFKKAPKHIHIDCLRDTKQELTKIARRINELVRNENLRYRDIAIVTGDVNIYAGYVREIFDKYNIPYFIDATQEILFHPFIEFIRSIPDIAAQNFSADAVFRFLRCGFSELLDSEIDVLENYVLACGVRGKSAWDKKWVRLPKHKAGYDIELLNQSREYIMELLKPVYQVFSDKKSTVKDYVLAIYKLIVLLDIPDKLAKKEQALLDAGDQTASKEYGQIYKIVMQLFEKYVAVLGDECMDAEEFTQILDAGLDAADVAVIPPGYDTVTIGDIERTRLEHIRVLFFVGVNDGVIPKADNHGGIISELERERLFAEHIELAPTARERAFIQKFYLYLNMTKPSEKLYITYAKVNMDGKAQRRSYLVGTVSKLFPKLAVEEIKNASDLRLVTPESSLKIFLDGLSGVREGTMEEEWKALYAWYASKEKWAGRVEKLLDAAFYCHASERLTKDAASALYGAVLTNSVTRLERFASCAFSHFLSYGLGLTERKISEFTPPDLGNILHQALETYSKALEKSEYDWFSVPDAEMERMAGQALEDAVAAMRNTSLYDTARDAYMVERMHALLNRTVKTITEQIKRGSFLPENYEVSFSFTEDLDAVNFALGEKEKMRLKGRIDRMDLWKNEDDIYVKIVDYKSGGSTQFELLSIYHGLQLQLVVYLNAGLELIQKRYPGKKVLPGGIFYYHMDDPYIDVSEERSEEEIFEEILGKLKMDGLVNAKTEVIDAMDRDLTGTSVVLPVGRKKDGSLKAGSHAVGQEEFGELSAFVHHKIAELGTDILAGNIDAAPYRLDKKEACAFCPYHGVCGFDEKMPGFSYRNLKKFDSDEEIFAQMRKEEFHGHDVDGEPEKGH